MTTPRPVLVVGGGVSGLVVAFDLVRAGIPVHLLEAGDRCGGTVARHTLAGIDLDAGAESFALATPAVPTLVDDLGLTGSVVSPDPAGAWVRHEAGTAPLPPGGLLGIPPTPWSAPLRRVIGTRGALRAGADRWLPARVGTGDGSLGSLVRHRMGRRVLDRLVEPVAGGVYSTDPDRLETASINPRLLPALARTGSLAAAVRDLRGTAARPGAAVAGLRGGLYGLVVALQRAVTAGGGRISTSTRVSELTRLPDGGWTARTSAGTLEADRIVLATEGPTAHRLLGTVPAGATDTTDVVLVTLVVDCPTLDTHPRGTGVLVSRGAGDVAAKALTHATAKWQWLAEIAGPGRHVVRLSYGRGDGAAFPGDLTTTAHRDASLLLGVPLPDPIATATTPWTATVPRPGPGHRDAAATWRTTLPSGLVAVGTHLAGTGLAAVVADARAVAADLLTDRHRPVTTEERGRWTS